MAANDEAGSDLSPEDIDRIVREFIFPRETQHAHYLWVLVLIRDLLQFQCTVQPRALEANAGNTISVQIMFSSNPIDSSCPMLARPR